MIKKNRIQIVLLIPLILCVLIVNTASVFGAPSDYKEIGIEENTRYKWTVSEANEEKIVSDPPWYTDPENSLTDFREDSKLIYDIEYITSKKDGGNPYWRVICEIWDFGTEEDDDGKNDDIEIYSDAEGLGNDFAYFFEDHGDPDSIFYGFLFLPQDIEDYINETVYYALDEIDNVTQDGREIRYESSDSDIKLTYNKDGILDVLEVKYNGKTLYKLELAETIDIPLWISPIWIYLGIGGAVVGVIVVVIVIIIRRKKLYSIY